jgi:hypothetical protein
MCIHLFGIPCMYFYFVQGRYYINKRRYYINCELLSSCVTGVTFKTKNGKRPPYSNSIKYFNKLNCMCIHNASLRFHPHSVLNLQGIFFLTTYIHLEDNSYCFGYWGLATTGLYLYRFQPISQPQYCCQNHVSPVHLRWRFWDNIDYSKPSIIYWIDCTTSILNTPRPTTQNKVLCPQPTEFIPEIIWHRTISGLLFASG